MDIEGKVHPLFLTFLDSRTEEEYKSSSLYTKPLPVSLKVKVAFVVCSIILFGEKLIGLLTRDSEELVPSGPLWYELFMVIGGLIMILIEVYLRIQDRLLAFHGFMPYTMCLIGSLIGGFFVSEEPVLDVYAFGTMMISQGAFSFYGKYWLTGALANLLVTILSLILYIGKYNSVVGIGGLTAGVIFIVMGLNFISIVFYIYERTIRRVFLLSKKMKDSKKRWKQTMNSLPVGVVLIDKNNNAKYANQEINSLIGLNNHLDRSTDIIHDIHHFQPDKIKELFRNIVERADHSVSLLQMVQDSLKYPEFVPMIELERKKPFEVKICPISEEKQKIVLLKDQTIYEQLLLERTMDKYQRMLLSSISHEIRNPLNAIEGYAASAEVCTSVEEIRTNIQQILYQGERISLLMTGACDLMLSDINSFILYAEPFSAIDLIQDVLHLVRPMIQSKDVSLRVQSISSVPSIINSMEQKYKLILYHLLYNAAKYTYEGSIEIDLSYSEEKNLLFTKIIDTGVGISREKLRSMFNLYSNIENSNIYNPQGMGLGLNLCKKLVTVLGGELEIDSVEKRGTTVAFGIKNLGEVRGDEDYEVPLEGIGGTAIQAIKIFFEPKLIHEPEPQKLTCTCPQALVVDDDPTNRMVVLRFLKKAGFQGVEEDNGLMAIEAVKERINNSCCKRFRFIFMDINMPVMDGTEATKHLISLFKIQPELSAPIIAVTAANLQSREDIQSLLSIGFHTILSKPVSQKSFFDLLQRIYV